MKWQRALKTSETSETFETNTGILPTQLRKGSVNERRLFATGARHHLSALSRWFCYTVYSDPNSTLKRGIIGCILKPLVERGKSTHGNV
jgi:hypothetical protein